MALSKEDKEEIQAIVWEEITEILYAGTDEEISEERHQLFSDIRSSLLNSLQLRKRQLNKEGF